ncbi:dithiol-disulfide isomerase [Pedobacter sp. BAL39]|uniref:DsbA family oxidoreductase n=1 Tax=Pedobacter sp. BAL39 TaxID=391596 RepID=UPI0001559CA7|nr:DsbA family oxidoreductase [Pedobacter sp. BAL39]EDM38373.1 dithiol-disulfide isomerase [Pedobacter sp. BAL39]
MRVDIWSDVRCPFCYIGKRKFERALAEFVHKDAVEIEWHSFELDPNAETLPDQSAEVYLAEKFGRSREWAAEMQQQVTDTAAEVGLRFDLSRSVVANSFDAHRLIQLAKSKGLDNEIEEALFEAHFSNGINIADHDALQAVGVAVGLNVVEIADVLSGDAFTDEVRADEHAAQTIGIRGVPFFVIDQKLAVSGAQPPETFLGALNKAWDGKTAV